MSGHLFIFQVGGLPFPRLTRTARTSPIYRGLGALIDSKAVSPDGVTEESKMPHPQSGSGIL